MTKEEYLNALGEQVHRGEPLCCPVCSTNGAVQPLASFGSNRAELFCPHCDAYIKFEMHGEPNG